MVLKFGGACAGPFPKVKGLISSMLAKLQVEADHVATDKAYCHVQLAETEAKRNVLEQDIATMTSNVGRAAARSARQECEVQVLEAVLAALAKGQAHMASFRQKAQAE